jgi:RHS repeat-associated protein
LKNYAYNNLGAVTAIASMNGIDSTMAEQFGYGNDGRIKRYSKKLYSPSQEIYNWNYRYSALGGREQKRLYNSTAGDSINGDRYNHYSWTYYMLGAGGEQLAVYKGVQVAHEDSSGHKGRRVYMYNESFISLGGTLVTLPDKSKQFNAMDNIGSVRLTVTVKDAEISYQSFDYKPFGDTLNAGGESRIGYAAQERDEESRYFAMGARQYDPLSGRFLSVDPLYESFPDKTPYHYCNNNPISFKDPSGLSPEEEKINSLQ